MDPILTIARQHLSDALNDPGHGRPDPGPRWGTLAAWCRQNIPNFRSAEQALHFAQAPLGHGGFEARLTGEALAENVKTFDAMLRRDFPQAVSHFPSFIEPEASRSETTTVLNGRRVSSPLVAHMLFYFSCATRIPEMDCVCEIGGGYGGPARLFLTNSYRRPRCYTILDLPESLFFAEVYLHLTLGGERVHYVQGGDTADPRTMAEGTVILCPVARRSALRPIHFDLVLNTLSMQEMTDEYVTFYRDWLNEQSTRYFYSFNYFMQNTDDRTESANMFAPRLSDRWDIVWSTTMGKRPYLCAHVLACRTEPSTIAERNRLTIARHFKRPLDLDSIYPLLHVAETSTDARFLYELILALIEDFDFKPKEVFFLIQRLDCGQPALAYEERQNIVRLRADFARLAEGDARVPPHLAAMQQDLYSETRQSLPDPSPTYGEDPPPTYGEVGRNGTTFK
jgi:putative sugar O-methyltransferase